MIRRVNRKFSNIAVPAVFDRLCFYEEVNLGRDLDTWIEDESCHDLAQHVKQVSWVWPKALTRVGQGFLARATAARALFPKLNTMRVRLQDQPKISDDRWYNDEDDEEEDMKKMIKITRADFAPSFCANPLSHTSTRLKRTTVRVKKSRRFRRTTPPRCFVYYLTRDILTMLRPILAPICLNARRRSEVNNRKKGVVIRRYLIG
jgi:hypothetical protein